MQHYRGDSSVGQGHWRTAPDTSYISWGQDDEMSMPKSLPTSTSFPLIDALLLNISSNPSLVDGGRLRREGCLRILAD
jgi:hypothetical protein